MSWSLVTAFGAAGLGIRPAIGTQFGVDSFKSQVTLNETVSATWVTPVEAGTYDVRLQVSSAAGSNVSAYKYIWTLMVFPDEQSTIPAVGNIGLGILIATLLAGGGWIISRRSGLKYVS